jgi:hypothetical protein
VALRDLTALLGPVAIVWVLRRRRRAL